LKGSQDARKSLAEELANNNHDIDELHKQIEKQKCQIEDYQKDIDQSNRSSQGLAPDSEVHTGQEVEVSEPLFACEPHFPLKTLHQ